MNRVVKYILLVVVVSFIYSCRCNKVTTTSTVMDSVYVNNTQFITAPTKGVNTYKIECDSTGQIKPFKSTSEINGITTSIEVKDGLIVSKVTKEADTVSSTSIEHYNNTSTVIEVPVEVPKPYIPKILWYSLGGNLLAVAWFFKGLWMPKVFKLFKLLT